MEKVKTRTSKYEISVCLKNNKYYNARVSLNFGSDCKRRIEKSGTTQEIAILNLLNDYLSYLDVSFYNGMIHSKIDDIVTQRLIKSISDIGTTEPEIMQKALEIVNKINYINSCILNTINFQPSILPVNNASLYQSISNNIIVPQFGENQIQQCLIQDLANEWFKYRLTLCQKTADNPKPLSQNTIDNNFDRLNDDILPYFQKKKILYLSQLNEDIIKDLIKSINCQNSKHKAYIVLNMLFKYAIKNKKAKVNIMDNVDKPPEKIITGEEDDDTNYIETERQGIWLSLFEKENTDMSLLFETMLMEGLRPEEACRSKMGNRT